MIYTDYAIVLGKSEMTDRFIKHHSIDDTVSVWPTYDYQHTFKINGSKQALIELRDLLNDAIAEFPAEPSGFPMLSEAMGSESDRFEQR